MAYMALLHPLRDYPGPLLAKLTDGYGGYYASKRCLHLRTYQDYLKYGSEVPRTHTQPKLASVVG